MPAPTPESAIKELLLSVTIKVNGAKINDTYAVISVNVFHEINRISYAEVVLSCGEIEADSHPVTDSSDLNPGNDIVIQVGFGSSDEYTVFTGVIVKHGVEISTTSAFNARIVCKHKAISTTFNKTESEFAQQADSAAITSIFGNYSGLSATVDATTPVQENIFQKLATDWDFVLSRAEFFGYIITMDGDSIFVGKPKLTTEPVLLIGMGQSIISFNAELNAERQAPSLDASAWDIKTQALIKESATEPGLNDQGDVSASSMSSKLSQKKLSLLSSTPMASDELKAWADGQLLRTRLGALKGSVTFVGSGLVKTGDLIQLEGVGTKFNGKAFVSAVHHTIDQNKWNTKVKFGLDPKYIHHRPDFNYPEATGQLPAIHGLHVATVMKISEDPQSLYRILVNIPTNSQTQTGFWARLSTFYATSGAGAFFFPEIGDEVIVGFLENDPRYPIIIGSVYSSKLKPPVEPADNNNYIKTLVTKAQLKMTFDDEKKIITIVTPGANTIILSDDGKSIEIKDQNNNDIKMSSSGISISSDKDVTISAQNISMTAKAKISLSANQDAVVEGLNVNLTAKVGFAAKGTTAEVSGTGQTTIKGAIVMIN
jgi:Rhs element Vgr protein